MSRYKGNAEKCPHCRITYKLFRTGHTYDEVKKMMWDYSPDPTDWKYKRRGTVLGKWFQIKQELWEQHTKLGWCPKDPRNLKVGKRRARVKRGVGVDRSLKHREKRA
jgi:hypothetical protein